MAWRFLLRLSAVGFRNDSALASFAGRYLPSCAPSGSSGRSVEAHKSRRGMWSSGLFGSLGRPLAGSWLAFSLSFFICYNREKKRYKEFYVRNRYRRQSVGFFMTYFSASLLLKNLEICFFFSYSDAVYVLR